MQCLPFLFRCHFYDYVKIRGNRKRMLFYKKEKEKWAIIRNIWLLKYNNIVTDMQSSKSKINKMKNRNIKNTKLL